MVSAGSGTEREESATVDGSPTKEFFISMLVKDTDFWEAVLDLVDNCMDGAKRSRGETETLEGLVVNVLMDDRMIEVDDNCGGIPLEQARKHAFRFGREGPAAATNQPKHALGMAGVGMKRAFFKLGQRAEVTSRTATETFVVVVDVEEWKKDPTWDFPIRITHGEGHVASECGSTVRITALWPDVIEAIHTDRLTKILGAVIPRRYEQFATRGLAIRLNSIPLGVVETQLLASQHLRPAFRKTDVGAVKVRIYAGIASSSPKSAGWYVYCNGRMVLDADRSPTTGWDGERVPVFHNQFARFRGYVFLDADEPAVLPWNTTKTNVDEESKLYRAVRGLMVDEARNVVDFLNQLDAERDTESTVLQGIAEKADFVALTQVNEGTFGFDAQVTEAPRVTNISYKRPTEQVVTAKEVLGVTSAREVGERSFDYYYSAECEEG